MGNSAFVQLYDKIVPNSFRVVVDGDIVPGLPPTRGYRHVGTSVVVDSEGFGSIIIDPSFVERWLRMSTASLEAKRKHSLVTYKIGNIPLIMKFTSKTLCEVIKSHIAPSCFPGLQC